MLEEKNIHKNSYDLEVNSNVIVNDDNLHFKVVHDLEILGDFFKNRD